MRYSLALVIFICSCSTSSVVTVDGINVKTGNQVGGVSETVVKKGETVVYHKVDNQESFRHAAATAKMGIGAATVASLGRTISSAYQSVNNTKTAAEISKTSLTEATKQKSAEEVTKRAAIEAVPVE